MDERFTNDAALGQGSFPTNGDPSSATAQKGDLIIDFDAATGSYTISSGGITQSFAQSDITSQNSGAWNFEKVSGNTSDLLVLTKPGTSGALNYQYVGGGIWERRVNNGAVVNGTLSAFSYGVETPDAAKPTTGSANYGIEMIGSSGQLGYSGQGNLTADFVNGQLVGELSVDEIMDGGVLTSGHRMTLSGSISSSANLFSGVFALNTFDQYEGSFDGRFFGPNAEELGASFYGNGNSNLNTAIVGFILGRRGGSGGTNATLTNLVADEFFLGTYSSGGYTLDANGIVVRANTGGRATRRLDYQASDQSFEFNGGDIVAGKFLPSHIVADPDQRFIVYERGPGDRLLMYRPGNGNPEIQLTYASYMLVDQRVTGSLMDTGVNLTYYHWGIPTKVMPRTGTGNYTGVINGRGISDANVYELSGTSNMTVNFQNQGLQGTLSPIGTLLSGGSPVNFGTFNFDAGLDPQSSRFQGNVEFNTYLGSAFIEGAFYGPNASEFSAVFGGIDFDDPLAAGNVLTLFGATLGIRN